MARENRAFYDTNVLIAYLFREENRFETAREVLKKHCLKALSVISIHEIHMYSIRFGVEDRFIEIKDLLDNIFKIVPLNQEICLKASCIRYNYGLPEVDALILASAVYGRYGHFYTFDKDFEELDGTQIEETMIHYLR